MVSKFLEIWWMRCVFKSAGGLQGPGQFLFQDVKGQADQLAGGDHHDIHTGLTYVFVLPENFPDSSLGPVPDHRIADFPGGDDSEASETERIGQKKESAGPVNGLFAAAVKDVFKIGPGQETFLFRKRLIPHSSDRKPFTSFAPPVGEHPAPTHRCLTGTEPVGSFSS